MPACTASSSRGRTRPPGPDARSAPSQAEGGFRFTTHDHERLRVRAKPGHDDASSSGNGALVPARIHSGQLVGESRFLNAAEGAHRLFAPTIAAQASAFANPAIAMAPSLVAPAVVVLRGPDHGPTVWKRALAAHDLPASMVVPAGAVGAGLPEVIDKPMPDVVNAWVWRGVACMPPMTSLAEVLAAPGSA